MRRSERARISLGNEVGKVVLYEYLEEHPAFLSNIGMASTPVHYGKEKGVHATAARYWRHREDVDFLLEASRATPAKGTRLRNGAHEQYSAAARARYTSFFSPFPRMPRCGEDCPYHHAHSRNISVHSGTAGTENDCTAAQACVIRWGDAK